MGRAKKTVFVPTVGEAVIVPLGSGKAIGRCTKVEGRSCWVDVSGVTFQFFLDDVLPHSAENFHLPEGR